MTIRRTAGAVIALVALVVAIVLLRSGGDAYHVQIRFADSGLLVNGGVVTVAGEKVGTVEDLRLSDESQAVAEVGIDSAFAPLREGTRAVIRKRSLSGEASDYIDLQLGPGDAKDLPDGATIGGINTDSSVPLDVVVDTFDPIARVAVTKSVDFFRDTTLGREQRANASLRYLNPALSSSSRLLEEVGRDRPDLVRFVTATSSLLTDISARGDALAELIPHLSTTMGALAARRADLGDAVEVLPSFLRRADSTFAGLRGTLDRLDPLVTAAGPVVANDLRPLLTQLRAFAPAARAPVRDLSRTIRQPGPDNDLVELVRAQPAVDRIANRAAQRNGETRPGALPAIRTALRGVTPQIAFARPYSVDAVGWFDDFSATGAYDALGGFSRAGLGLNGFTFSPTLSTLIPIPPPLRDALSAGLSAGRNNRCPGSIERAAADGSNPYLPSPGFNCDPTQVPIGP